MTTTNNTDMSITNQLNEETLETKATLLQSDTTTVNSREFVEKSDDILSSTNKLIINLSEEPTENEPFHRNAIRSVFHVWNRDGDHVFTIGKCPTNRNNVQSFIISNSVGHGLMNFVTKGFLNMECDVDGAGLLSFTQIQHFHGGYKLRDPYKDVVKIRSGWIPFCSCCISYVSSTSIAITDLDGTSSGNIIFEKSDSGCRTLSVNFIPNLNPKAKYMLLAASIKLMCYYFSH